MPTKRNGRSEKKVARTKAPPLDVRPSPDAAPSIPDEPRHDVGCVVAIAVTRAGLNSALDVVRALPRDGGAVVVISVPDADGSGDALAKQFAAATELPVHVLTAGTRLLRDSVGLALGRAALTLEDGVIRRGRELERPIDSFFRAIAGAAGPAAIAVVLSGETTDGALGIQAIKAEGGICFAEHESTGAASEMPAASAATGSVDAVLGARAIGAEVARVVREMGKPAANGQLDIDSVKGDGELRRLFTILRRARDTDFSNYRPTTIKRRIARRMMLSKVSSLAEYVAYLAERPAEIEALYQDILIKVTHFFRDPQTFEALASRVFPEMIRNRERELPLRIWVPGCSTGEEPYSIAIILLELLSDLRASLPVQIFASDASEAAIERARAGRYLENIALDVAPERLRRFFTKGENHYRVGKALRDMCIFAKQDITRDPPFSKLDLISCRNVLIYLEPVVQKKVIAMFHYALRTEGRLILGTSETIAGAGDLFSLVDKHVKLYAKTVAPPRMNLEYTGGQYPSDPIAARAARPPEAAKSMGDIGREADRIVIGRYAPAGVVITSDLHIVQFRGQTGPYLEPAPGDASFHLLKMAREGLMLDLRTAVERAKRTDVAAQKDGVRVRTADGYRDVNIEVIPIRDPRAEGSVDAAERYFLVLFDEPRTSRPITRPGKAPPRTSRAAEVRRVRKLEEELVAAKGYLQAIIDEQEATNEELQSANEEVLSSNEELQSINEELETAKEELQSTNEELTTLNEELENRNRDLATSNTDLMNLLASVNIAIVMVSRDLRIRRFTPLAERLLNLIPGDLGRPLGDIKPKLEVPDLEALASRTIENGKSQERDVHDREGRRYSLRVCAYLTGDGRIDGAVIFMLDIDGWNGAAAG